MKARCRIKPFERLDTITPLCMDHGVYQCTIVATHSLQFAKDGLRVGPSEGGSLVPGDCRACSLPGSVQRILKASLRMSR